MNNLLEPHVESLEIIFSNYFTIPIYQRPYCWEKSQIQELLSDIEDYIENRHNSQLYIGSIYLSRALQNSSNVNCYEIIDGQQRIATFSLILLILYYKASKYKLENDDSVLEIKSILWKKIINQREVNRDYPIINFKSLEKKIMKNIFDYAFNTLIKNNNEEETKEESQDLNLIDYVKNYNCENEIEKKVKNNFLLIDDYLNKYLKIDNKKVKEEDKKNKLLTYIDFVLKNITFLTLIVTENHKSQVFEIFESINGKGKILEEIDIIKCFIFQNLTSEDQQQYLEKWGDLIIKTEDKLQEYLNIYIKAFIKYNSNNVNSSSFKKIDFKTIYKKTTLSEALVKFLDDLIEKVKYYKYLKNDYFIDNNKFKYYMCSFRLNEYFHPCPLLLRAFYEYDKEDLTKNDLILILKNSFSYMFATQTINDGDSKDAVDTFNIIMTKTIEDNRLSIKDINEVFKTSMIERGVNGSAIKSKIENFTGYTKKGERAASRVLLSFYDLYDFSKNNIDYDKALIILENSNIYQIDHILPLNPEESEKKVKYEKKLIKNNKYELILKKGHDFPENIINADYETFEKLILNKLGNLNLLYRGNNIKKSNTIIKLPNYDDFNTYKKITKRAKEMSEKLFEKELFTIDNHI